jgi:hypothetical protein
MQYNMVKNILVVMLQDKNKAETKGPIRIGAYCPCLIIWGPAQRNQTGTSSVLALEVEGPPSLQLPHSCQI